MNEKEQLKADKELLKELSSRFVKAYSDHEFKLLLKAQKRIIQFEKRERIMVILKKLSINPEPEAQGSDICADMMGYNRALEDVEKQILSDNQPNND